MRVKIILNNITKGLSSISSLFYSSYFLAFIGLIFFSSYIYLTFFRTRIPKDIPFNLTEIWFYIIIFICFMYIYTIRRILKPKNPPLFIIKFLQKISYPVAILDYYFKNNKVFKPRYDILKNNIISFLITWSYSRPILIICFELIPRVVLILIFFVDVFFVGKIEIFYYFILLSLFPLAFQYFQYSLISARHEYITYLDTLYDEVWVLDKYSEYKPIEEWHPQAIYHDKNVSIRKYLEIQEKNSMIDYPHNFEMEYHGIPLAREKTLHIYLPKYNKIMQELTQEDYDNLKKPFYDIMDTLITFNSYLENFKFTSTYYNFISYTKIFICSLYFLC